MPGGEYPPKGSKTQTFFSKTLHSRAFATNPASPADPQAAEKGEEEDDNAAFLTFLLALVDYGTFVQMMKETAGVE